AQEIAAEAEEEGKGRVEPHLAQREMAGVYEPARVPVEIEPAAAAIKTIRHHDEPELPQPHQPPPRHAAMQGAPARDADLLELARGDARLHGGVVVIPEPPEDGPDRPRHREDPERRTPPEMQRKGHQEERRQRAAEAPCAPDGSLTAGPLPRRQPAPENPGGVG